MNPALQQLQPYPFAKIRTLLEGAEATQALPAISLAIGEPKHPIPAFIQQAVADHLSGLGQYPVSRGEDELREVIAQWLIRRFQLPPHSEGILSERHILPVNGTREALFSMTQACINREQPATVVMPNPFYQIYEGAALLAGAQPVYLPCEAADHFIPDFAAVPESVWKACQLVFICTPGNPTGSVMPLKAMQQLIELAQRYDFIVASDECYSELYFDEDNPPPGLLQAAAAMGNTDYQRCLVFHSLSKRSNVPGMRSGFVAGDAEVLKAFLLYRTYHGCTLPPPLQAGSMAAWRDEAHVRENRALYRAKFAAVLEVLKPVMNVEQPDAGFYLWPETPGCDAAFTRSLYIEKQVKVVPGSYLSREAAGINPGDRRIRIALVESQQACLEAAMRIRDFIENA